MQSRAVSVTLSFFIFVVCASGAYGNWTWMTGSSSSQPAGVYGTLGTAGSSNHPGPRHGANIWRVGTEESTAVLYLFGGYGYGRTDWGNLADMWMFDPQTNWWTWIFGPSDSLNRVSYNPTFTGSKGVYASGNLPDGRYRSCSFTYNGELYMFGGELEDSGLYNDFWKFSTSLKQWAWLQQSISNVKGSYGTQGVYGSSNYPAARTRFTCWNPVIDVFYIFGGLHQKYDSGSTKFTDELWGYNLTSLQWAWLKGASTGSQASMTYGSLNSYSSSNTPGSTYQSASWTNSKSQLYLYGGYHEPDSTVLGGVWTFSLQLQQWKVITLGTSQVWNNIGEFSSTSNPGRRYLSEAWETPLYNAALVFGGKSFNQGGIRRADLWEFDMSLNQWRWVKGDSNDVTAGTYGTKLVSSPQNNPDDIVETSLVSIGKYFYLQGGILDSSSTFIHNSLWRLEYCPSYTDQFGQTFTCQGCGPGQVYDSVLQSCANCPAGTYKSSTTGSCLSCAIGSVSSAGSSACVQCIPGKYKFNDSSCADCDPGKYTSSSGSLTCSSCDVGSIAPGFQSTTCTSCLAGKFYVSSTSCTDCLPGTFSMSNGSTVCASCTFGKVSFSSGLSSCSSCSPGEYYANSTFCGICPTGKFSYLNTSLCESCAAGSIAVNEGSSSCTLCSSGKYYVNGTTCVECPSGFFSLLNGSTACEECSLGKVALYPGRSACSDCASGSFAINSTFCGECPIGTFASSITQSCEVCAAGKVAPQSSSSSCQNCQSGTYSVDGINCLECSPGKFSISGYSSCSDCPSGSINNASGSSSCIQCAMGTYYFSALECRSCPAGKISDVLSSLVCNPCYSGTFSLSSQSQCSDCAIGLYNNASEQSSCSECNSDATTVSSGSKSISSCACKEGFWGEAYLGAPCKKCPLVEGLSCPLNSSVPRVLPGYYRDETNPELIYSCVPKSACKATEFSNTICEEGYTGNLCSECIKFKYYRSNFECKKCPNKGVLIVVALILLVAFMIFSVRLISSNIQIPYDVRIAVTSLQIVSLFPGLSTEWPHALLSLFKITSVVNLNIDLFNPDCSIDLSFWAKTNLKLMIPFIVVAWFAIAYAIKKFIANKDKPLGIRLRLCFQFEKLFSLMIYVVLVLYAVLASTALSVFNCSKVNESTYVSVHSPDVKCFTQDWGRRIVLVCIFICIYVIIFPVYCAFNLWSFRKDLQNPKFVSRFQNFVRPYKPEFFFWELVDLLKKTVFVISTDFLAYDRSVTTKSFLTIFFLFLFFSLETRYRPWKRESHNQFGSMWGITTIILLLSSLVFQSDQVTRSEKDGFSVLMMIVLILMLILTLYRVFTLFFHWRAAAKSRRHEILFGETTDMKVSMETNKKLRDAASGSFQVQSKENVFEVIRSPTGLSRDSFAVKPGGPSLEGDELMATGKVDMSSLATARQSVAAIRKELDQTQV